MLWLKNDEIWECYNNYQNLLASAALVHQQKKAKKSVSKHRIFMVQSTVIKKKQSF